MQGARVQSLAGEVMMLYGTAKRKKKRKEIFCLRVPKAGESKFKVPANSVPGSTCFPGL